MNYNSEMNETVYDAMCFMDAIWQCETFDDEFFTKCDEFCMDDTVKLFKECRKDWKEYEGPVGYFSEYSLEWLKNRQAEIDALKELKEIQFADLPKGHTWECCPFCNSEVVIPSYKMSFCPNCGEKIAPCNTCPREGEDCGDCYFKEKEKSSH